MRPNTLKLLYKLTNQEQVEFWTPACFLDSTCRAQPSSITCPSEFLHKAEGWIRDLKHCLKSLAFIT